ncbi:hypothetical protein M407DRAFT_33518 [Tulasnella calospora MUT 4182]|uniref:Uncharacterized protein n=1 Tax=Tulasnella calospora MUT 4182 TaxID=1051891 RepID=A0A0C3L5S5_9AGAM|nr:hypothetical protein M407DRAFT_33518 [Tulasnella calospora MUT 4182]
MSQLTTRLSPNEVAKSTISPTASESKPVRTRTRLRTSLGTRISITPRAETMDWSANGDYIRWEGQQQDIYFRDSAVSLQTHIDGDAQSRGFQAYAGSAQRTSDGKRFTCYKDNYRQLFF